MVIDNVAERHLCGVSLCLMSFMLSVANKPYMASVSMLNVVVLSVVMLSVFMLSVIMISVIMPNVVILWVEVLIKTHF